MINVKKIVCVIFLVMTMALSSGVSVSAEQLSDMVGGISGTTYINEMCGLKIDFSPLRGMETVEANKMLKGVLNRAGEDLNDYIKNQLDQTGQCIAFYAMDLRENFMIRVEDLSQLDIEVSNEILALIYDNLYDKYHADPSSYGMESFDYSRNDIDFLGEKRLCYDTENVIMGHGNCTRNLMVIKEPYVFSIAITGPDMDTVNNWTNKFEIYETASEE